MRAWVEENSVKDGEHKGSVDMVFFYDIYREVGSAPAALKSMPRIDPMYSPILGARQELSCGDIISYAEMNAYLIDYPGIDGARFKSLLRVLDLGYLA